MATINVRTGPVGEADVLGQMVSESGHGHEILRAQAVDEFDSLDQAGFAAAIQSIHREYGLVMTNEAADSIVQEHKEKTIGELVKTVVDRCNELMMQKSQKKR